MNFPFSLHALNIISVLCERGNKIKMDVLLQLCEWLPRLPPNLQPFQFVNQLPFTLKDLVVTLLSATHPTPEPDFATVRLQHKGPSELPYYGRSPPVYPSRTTPPSPPFPLVDSPLN